MNSAEVLSRETVFKGKVFDVERAKVKLPHGRESTQEVVRHSKSAVLVPVPEPGHVILIRQYRFALNAWMWELPAGSVDEGESPEQAAVRECHEEIGKVPATVVRLAALYPTPGYCDEEMIFFRLADLRPPAPDSPRHADPDENIETRSLTIDEVRAMVRSGEIVDLKTAFGLTLV